MRINGRGGTGRRRALTVVVGLFCALSNPGKTPAAVSGCCGDSAMVFCVQTFLCMSGFPRCGRQSHHAPPPPSHSLSAPPLFSPPLLSSSTCSFPFRSCRAPSPCECSWIECFHRPAPAQVQSGACIVFHGLPGQCFFNQAELFEPAVRVATSGTYEKRRDWLRARRRLAERFHNFLSQGYRLEVLVLCRSMLIQASGLTASVRGYFSGSQRSGPS